MNRRKETSVSSLLILLAMPLSMAGQCSSQGTPAGKYVIMSYIDANTVGMRCLDAAREDSAKVQLWGCNSSNNPTDNPQVWDLEPGPDTGGCYIMYDYTKADGVGAHVELNNDCGFPNVTQGCVNKLVRNPNDAGGSPALWQVLKNPNGTFTFKCFKACGGAVTATGCMDRRNPDDQGRAQVINCEGIDSQLWYLQAASGSRSIKKKSPPKTKTVSK